MSWVIDILGNYSKVISGYAFKSDSFRTDNGIPIIKIKNIQREYVEIDGEYFVDTSYLSLDPKFHCIKDDILISLTGSHITLPNSVVGRVAKYHYDFTSLLNQRGGKIVVTNPDKLENNYLYYYLCQNEIRIKLAQFGRGGANQCNISPSNVESIPIILPPLETQKRIASILSTYDDLIENNLKRIKLLEETAQNIYKEWFVNFRFPNYEHTEFDSESGLPVGWRKGIVADLCEVKSGYAFKSKDWQTEGNPVMKIKNITNNTVDITDCDFVDDEVAQNAEKFELFEGDVLIAMTGATVGKVGLIPKIDKRIYINQRVGLFRPFSEIENNVYLVFSFFMTDDALKQILNFAGGAAQPNISSSQISDVELNIGSDEILKMFESKIQSIMVQIQTLYSQNQKLKEARDILLPRLMNRTIEV